MILTKVCLIAVMLGWSGLGMLVGLLERDNIVLVKNGLQHCEHHTDLTHNY